MMLPYFIEAPYKLVKRKFKMPSEDFMWALAIFFGIVMIVLAVCSVTTLVHNEGTPQEYCTTVLGERTSCSKD